jgi:NAD(P)H dehydrogenase (quinone)
MKIRFWNFSPDINILKKGTLEFCGIKPVKVKIFDRVGAAKVEKIQKWIEEIKILGAKGE